MAESTQNPTLGSQLLAIGLRQGTYFAASELPSELLKEWADYRSDPSLRIRPIKTEALLAVVSQDCDIACHNHTEDPCIELAVFNPIPNKKMHPGNQFANSVRKLQLKLDTGFYEAKVRETVRVPKEQIIDNIDNTHIYNLSTQHERTLVLWRANRYLREAFPDRFVRVFKPIFDKYLPDLVSQSHVAEDTAFSYIRSLYVHLSNQTEEGQCGFTLTLLLRSDTPGDVQSSLDDTMEEICQEIEASDESFELLEDEKFAALAESERTMTVAILSQYVKYNLDSASLSNNDLDVGAAP